MSWDVDTVFNLISLGTKAIKYDAKLMKEATYSNVEDKPHYVYRIESRDYYCQVCDTSTSSKTIMTAHITGKEHLRRYKRVDVFECKLCSVVVSSKETLQSHFRVMFTIILF